MKRLIEYEKSFENLSDFLFNLSLYERSSEIAYLLIRLIKNNVVSNIAIAKRKKYRYLNKQSLKMFWITCKYKCPQCESIISILFPISMYNYGVQFFKECDRCHHSIKLK